MRSELGSKISPFLVMELLRRANALEAAGRHIIHMEAGQPAGRAPAPVLDAAEQALRFERLGYVEAMGTPRLRQAIAGYYRSRYGLEIDPGRIVVTTGSSGAFMLSFLAAVPAGGRIGLSAPYYPAYPNIMRALGFEPVILEAGPESGLQITLDLVRNCAQKLDGLMIASPANPTGSMISAEELSRLVQYCAAGGIALFSDEIYHGITYGAPARSALEFGDSAIVINSFSKYFAMSGWRLGWIVVPEDLVRDVDCLAQNFFISSPVLSQIAAVTALTCTTELDGRVAQYAKNRSFLMQALPGLGFGLKAPADGAFYLYTDLPDTAAEPLHYCLRLLEEAGVAITPGTDFDRGPRSRALRFSYAGPFEDMVEAVERLTKFVG